MKWSKPNILKIIIFLLALFLGTFFTYFYISGKERTINGEKLYKRLKLLSLDGFYLIRSDIDYDIHNGRNYYTIEMDWSDLKETEYKKLAQKYHNPRKIDSTLIHLLIYIDTSREEAEKHANYAYHVDNKSIFMEGSFKGVKIGDKTWIPKIPKDAYKNNPGSGFSIIFLKQNVLCMVYVRNFMRKLSPDLVEKVANKIESAIY